MFLSTMDGGKVAWIVVIAALVLALVAIALLVYFLPQLWMQWWWFCRPHCDAAEKRLHYLKELASFVEGCCKRKGATNKRAGSGGSGFVKHFKRGGLEVWHVCDMNGDATVGPRQWWSVQVLPPRSRPRIMGWRTRQLWWEFGSYDKVVMYREGPQGRLSEPKDLAIFEGFIAGA